MFDYNNLRHNLNQLDGAEIDKLLSDWQNWFDSENEFEFDVNKLKSINEKIEFVLDSDPIATDDGLLAFLANYMPIKVNDVELTKVMADYKTISAWHVNP